MKKSVTKRFKVTKHKTLRQPMARGHNRTRKTQRLIQQKRKLITINGINMKLLRNYLHIK